MNGLALLKSARLAGKGIAADLLDVVESATATDSIDGASTFDMTIGDFDGKLLRSGAFARKMDLKVGKQAYRLVAINKSGDRTIGLSFEDREIAELRGRSDPLTVSKQLSRAQFARLLAKEDKSLGIRFVSPSVRDALAAQSLNLPKSTAARTAAREPGLPLSASLTIQGAKADAEQLRNTERVLDVCYGAKVSKKMTIAAVETIIVENWCYNRVVIINGKRMTDLDSVGMFQQRPSQGWTGLYNIEKATREFLAKAAKVDKPSKSPGQLAQAVQGSAHPDRYDKWQAEALAIIAAYNGDATGAAEISTADPATSAWTRGSNGARENSWDCLGRLAEEVRWRRFMSGGSLFFVPDAYLLRSKPVMTVTDGAVGINEISFGLDIGKPRDRASVEIAYSNWTPPVGCTIEVRNQGPASGRWIVGEVSRDLFDEVAKLELFRPLAALPEPKETGTASNEEGGLALGGAIGVGLGVRDKIVANAREFYSKASQYTYKQTRPMPDSIWSSAARNSLDCSSSSTLIYKAAGAPDPNGAGYNGSGETGSLWRNGKRVGSAKPGDLVFYGWESGLSRPQHVAVYVGDGKVVSHGGSGNGHPKLVAINYRPIQGIRSYVDV